MGKPSPIEQLWSLVQHMEIQGAPVVRLERTVPYTDGAITLRVITDKVTRDEEVLLHFPQEFMQRFAELTDQFIDLEQARRFIEEAVKHYETQGVPSCFLSYLGDDLYVRIWEGRAQVDELVTLRALKEHGVWEQVNFAVNRIYKLLNRMGRDTSGMAGY